MNSRDTATGIRKGDILELGCALVAATPRLNHVALELVHDPAAARRLVQGVLKRAWLGRYLIDETVTPPDRMADALERQLALACGKPTPEGRTQ